MDTKLRNALIALLIGFVAIGAIRQFWWQKGSKLYPNFGINIPRGYNIHGIDVSKYQKNIDWELVSKMVDKGTHLHFAIIKSTEGNSLRDRYFNKNFEASKKHGLLRGAYLYFHPNGNGATQAAFFIKHTPLQAGDLAPVVDIEETNGTSKLELQKQLQACLTTLQDAYHATPIIYCNATFYNKYLQDTFDKYPLWVAHYYEQRPDVNRDWHIWQHNDAGTVNGIDAPVDFNVVNGSYKSLLDLCIE
jgi:lysozyme